MPIHYQLQEVANNKNRRPKHQKPQQKYFPNRKSLQNSRQSNQNHKRYQVAQNNHYNIGNLKTQKINGIKKVKIPELNFDNTQNSFQYKPIKNFQVKTSRNASQNQLKILARHHSKDSTKIKSAQKNIYDVSIDQLQKKDKSKFKIKLMRGSLLDRCKIQNSDQKQWSQRKLSLALKKSYSTVRKLLVKQHQRIFMMSTRKQQKESDKKIQKSYQNLYKKSYTQAINTNQGQKSNKSDESSQQKSNINNKLKAKILTQNRATHKSKPKCLITKTKKLPFEISHKALLHEATQKQIEEQKQSAVSENKKQESIIDVQIQRRQNKNDKCQQTPLNSDQNQQFWNLQLSQIFHGSDSQAFITIESYKKFECK